MERRHQPKPGFCELWPRQPTARQTCPRKVPTVTTLTLPCNATEAQGSCPQRSGETLELWHRKADWKCFWPCHRWIRWEIAISGHIKYREVIPGFCEILVSAARQCIPHGRRMEWCAMLGQRMRDPLLLLHPSPSGDWLWQSCFVPTIPDRVEEAGAMGGSSKFYWLLAL